MSDEIDAFRRRVETARDEVAALRSRGLQSHGEPGPADEETGERWNRGNVLGHVAEMVPFWTAQLRAVVEDGRTDIGRDEVGFVQRRQGIDSGGQAGPEDLLSRVDAGLEGLLALLSGLRAEDLDRRLTLHAPRVPARDLDVRAALEDLLVGHVEAHLQQFRELV